MRELSLSKNGAEHLRINLDLNRTRLTSMNYDGIDPCSCHAFQEDMVVMEMILWLEVLDLILSMVVLEMIV